MYQKTSRQIVPYPQTSDSITDKKDVFICFEFLETNLFQSKKQLTEMFRRCNKDLKVNVIFKSSNRITNPLRFKDVYLGKRKRHLLVHIYGHLEKSILTEKPSKYSNKDAAALGKHCHQNNHQADCFCFTLIGSASSNFRLKLKESLLISQLKLSLNVAKKSMPWYLFDNDA